MAENDPRSSRRKTALAAVAVIALAGVALLLWRPADRSAPAPPAPAAPTEAVPPRPNLPVPPPLQLPPPPLSRADLIAAAGRAAAAYAAGRPLPDDLPELVGRRFRVMIPFGCAGPQTAAAGRMAAWSFGPERKTIRVTVRPEDWTGAAFLADAPGLEELDTVEGYWIPRPWLLSEACPASGSAAEATAASPETVGLAALFEKGGSRLLRRGKRAYDLVRKADDGAPPAPQGFRLVMGGRVVGFGGDHPVHCHSPGVDQRPVCVFAVTIEQVEIQDPASGEALGEWRS